MQLFLFIVSKTKLIFFSPYGCIEIYGESATESQSLESQSHTLITGQFLDVTKNDGGKKINK